MLTFNQLSYWVRRIDVLTNRVLLISQLCGVRYDGAPGSVCQLSYRRGHYVVTICGEPYQEFEIYDFDRLEEVIAAVDALFEGLWLMNRVGMINHDEPTFVGKRIC